ncbi:O-antigen ligase family protein [Pseudonocardia adelaidensis]|uniref:O-antigen ligase-related domain-containing protein n=1 Tax=Pseudonocardia adelaidensis TaxID=648754 RepID=A0ABP9N8H8_9PSEU
MTVPVPVRGLAPGRADLWRLAAAVGLGLVLIAGAMREGPIEGPRGVLIVAMGGAAGVVVFLAPVATALLLLLASFFRLAIHVSGLPAEPMTLLFAALVVAVAIATLRGTIRLHFGPLEAVMLAYLLWNVVSAVWPHVYPAAMPLTGEPIVIYRFIMMGTVFPFAGYVVGRALFQSASRIRVLLFGVLGFAAYSALVSILQFTGPRALVWPKYIVDKPSWPERAVGVFDQPVVNGLVMSMGFIAAVFLAKDRSLKGWQRVLAGLVAPLCAVGIYLTHTRAVLIVFGLALVLCAFIAPNSRSVFAGSLIGAGMFVVAEWATIASADRAEGGLGSPSEVQDRLNMIQTSFWAIREEPIVGWGIGRFAQVNTHHHQQWATDINWTRGYGYSSHENELGIAVELGLIGLALWLVVLAMVAYQIVRAFRRLPRAGVDGRTIAVLAVVSVVVWVGSGATVDMRYNDFVNLLVFLIAGAAVGASIRQRDEQAGKAREPAGAST